MLIIHILILKTFWYVSLCIKAYLLFIRQVICSNDHFAIVAFYCNIVPYAVFFQYVMIFKILPCSTQFYTVVLPYGIQRLFILCSPSWTVRFLIVSILSYLYFFFFFGTWHSLYYWVSWLFEFSLDIQWAVYVCVSSHHSAITSVAYSR